MGCATAVDVGAGGGVGELTAVGGTEVGGMTVDVGTIVAGISVGRGNDVLVGNIMTKVGATVGLATGIVGAPMITAGGTSGG